MQPEWITMTAREQRRVQVLAQVLAGDLKLWEAAVVLGLSIRQTRRLKGALVRAGPAAVAHGNRGRSSPRRLPAELRQALIVLYQGTYAGLNHQHFCELLAEREGLVVSVASVRRILRAAGLGSPHTRRPAPRKPRAASSAPGALTRTASALSCGWAASPRSSRPTPSCRRTWLATTPASACPRAAPRPPTCRLTRAPISTACSASSTPARWPRTTPCISPARCCNSSLDHTA